jgi:signal transduction histidine kinase
MRNGHPTVRGRRSSSTTVRFASLALVFVTIVGLGAMAYLTEREIVVSRDWVIHTYQVRSQLSQLQLELLHAQASETSAVLLEQRDEGAQSTEQVELARQTVGVLRKLTADNPRQQLRLDQLGQIFSNTTPLSDPQNKNVGHAQVAPQVRARQDALESQTRRVDAIVHSMQDEEESLLQQRLSAWDYLFKRNVVMLGLAFAVVTLMLAYNFRRLFAEVANTKRMEKQVRENADSYRLMSARILELQDSERRRIARELHDSVGQYLAGLKISLSQIQIIPSDGFKAVREALELTDSAIQEVRTISHLLHPPLLEELGFLSAARWYLDEYGKRGQVRVSLIVDEPFKRLPKEIEMALFRVLQESLTNVYRHANAKSVDVRILCHDGHVTLSVADDGKGIPDEVLAMFRRGAAPGIGLAGMRERLAEFGGELRVEASGGGSIVAAVIPTNACALKKEVAKW